MLILSGLSRIIILENTCGVISWSLFKEKLYLDVILYNKERDEEIEMNSKSLR